MRQSEFSKNNHADDIAVKGRANVVGFDIGYGKGAAVSGYALGQNIRIMPAHSDLSIGFVLKRC